MKSSLDMLDPIISLLSIRPGKVQFLCTVLNDPPRLIYIGRAAGA